MGYAERREKSAARRVAVLLIPAALVVAVHGVLSLGFDAYTRAPRLDLLMHFAGGVAIAFTLDGGLALCEQSSLLRVYDRAVRCALLMCLVTAAATGWELVEFVGDRFFDTRAQKGVEDTMLDLLFGLLGGGLIGAMRYRRTIEERLRMWTSIKWLLALTGASAVVVFGLREDVDCCEHTSATVETLRLWGVPLDESRTPGYAPWLQELGIVLEENYVDYLEYHPLMPLASTPPGNWIYLRRAHQVYEEFPDARPAIVGLLERLEENEPPLFDEGDRNELCRIATDAGR